MEELVPSEFHLSQNFPNPFTGTTKIKYCVPVKTVVNLSVFNSDGEKVKELVNKIQEAGTYEVKLDNGDLQAGDYYYRLQTINSESITGQSYAETKKMLLIK